MALSKYYLSLSLAIFCFDEQKIDVPLLVAGTLNIPIVGVGKRGAYELLHGDLSRQHSLRTTLRFASPVPADSRQ